MFISKSLHNPFFNVNFYEGAEGTEGSHGGDGSSGGHGSGDTGSGGGGDDGMGGYGGFGGLGIGNPGSYGGQSSVGAPGHAGGYGGVAGGYAGTGWGPNNPDFSVPMQGPFHGQVTDAQADLRDMGYNSRAAFGQHAEQGNYGKAFGHGLLGLADDALGVLGGFLGANLGGAIGGTVGFGLGGPIGGLVGALGGSMGLGAAGKSAGQTVGGNMAADVALGGPTGGYGGPTGPGDADDGMGGGGDEPLNYAHLVAGNLMPDVPEVARPPALTSPYFDYEYNRPPYEINPHLQRQMEEYARRYGVQS